MHKIVIATGGFDPIHSGHIKYLNEAAKLGDLLVVGVNSDEWLRRKKGCEFLPWSERSFIVQNLKPVSRVFAFNDNDNSARDVIKIVREHYIRSKIIFANGGDRTEANIPEMDIEDVNIEFVFGVGGWSKDNSSSNILKNYSNNLKNYEHKN